MNRRRALILGASGKVGQCLMQKLPPEFPDWEWIGTGRKGGPGLLSFDPYADDWVKLGKFDFIINAAGAVPESETAAYYQVHETLVRLLVENRNLIGNPRIIHFSALHADASHPIEFLRSKGLGDALLEKQSDVLILKPAIICFLDAILIRKLKKLLEISRFFLGKAPLPAGFPETRIQPVMPEDMIDTVACALRRQDWPKSLELVGPEVFSFQNLMQKMASVKGRAFSSFPVPNSLVGALTRNFISIWFPGLVQYDEFQLGLKDQTGNVAQLEAFLGRKTLPTSPFWDEIQW